MARRTLSLLVFEAMVSVTPHSTTEKISKIVAKLSELPRMCNREFTGMRGLRVGLREFPGISGFLGAKLGGKLAGTRS